MRILAVLLFLLVSLDVRAQKDLENPLLQFSPLIGGEWDINDSFQTFEWGIGKKSVRSRKFIASPGGGYTSFETVWVWHPQRQLIIGSEITSDASIDFIEHEAYFKGDTLISNISSYLKGQKEAERYQESFVLSEISKHSPDSRIDISYVVLTPDYLENRLQPFEFLIGGAWVTPTTYQVFDWGLNRKSVTSQLYFIQEDSLKYVGDLVWFWHPESQAIRGYGTAIEMGVDMFDYNTSFENPKRMLNIFTAFGQKSTPITQMEALDFEIEDQYTWTYYNIVDGEASAAYSLKFNREERRTN